MLLLLLSVAVHLHLVHLLSLLLLELLYGVIRRLTLPQALLECTIAVINTVASGHGPYLACANFRLDDRRHSDAGYLGHHRECQENYGRHPLETVTDRRSSLI